MAQLNEEFSVDTLPASSSGDFSPIPAGHYNVRVVKADLTDTKDGTGQYIKLRLDVVGPTHQGRVLFANLNIRNQSAKAEEIGRAQMGDIMRAIGLPKVTDTDQFIGGEVAIRVETKDDEKYGPSNEVKAYKAIEGAAAPKAPPVQQKVGSPGAVRATPPWIKK